MAEKLKQAKVSDLTFDDKNFNKHTEYGMSLIEKSLRNNGAGRSILIDKNNRIIAGNGVVETAAQIGLDDVQIVETDGTKIIAVKRTDIDLDSQQGREMALADNATGAADLQWDAEELQKAVEAFGFEPEKWGVFAVEEKEEKKKEEKPEVPFTEVLNEESNYIVLYFDNSVDWLQAQTIFKIEQVKCLPTSKKDNKGRMRFGLGRVINGRKALDAIFDKLDWK